MRGARVVVGQRYPSPSSHRGHRDGARTDDSRRREGERVSPGPGPMPLTTHRGDTDPHADEGTEVLGVPKMGPNRQYERTVM